MAEKTAYGLKIAMEDIYMTSNSADSVGNMTTESEDDEKEGSKPTLATRLQNINTTPYRWFILTLYSLTAFSNTLVWLSLFTVSDATVVYYNITESMLVWSSTASTALQILSAIPLTVLPSSLGLRTTMILASSVNALGASIMIASTHRGGFPYFVAGQTVVALAASLLPQLAPHVSAVWFGDNEHSLSTSIGIIIGNAGAAVGFLQPALMIKNIEPAKHILFIDRKLKELIYSQATLCILMMILIVLFFKKKPIVPPSYSQAVRNNRPSAVSLQEVKETYKVLLKDKHYILCSHAFALNSLLLITVPIFLNAIISWRFPFHDVIVGWMGFGAIIAGIIGSFVFSIILDKTQHHKRIVIILGAISMVLWVTFIEILSRTKSISAIATLLVMCMFFFIPFGPVVVDMIVEMTYPITESTSFVVPITAGRFYSIPIVFALGLLIEKKQVHLLCYIVAGIMAVMLLLVVFSRVRRKRAEANVGIYQDLSGMRRPLVEENGCSVESLLHADHI